MNYTLRFVRITNQEKNPSRFATAQTKVSRQENAFLVDRLFFLIEIERGGFQSSQIAQLIINALTREYFHAQSNSDSNNFEMALKRVNETLAQIAQEGEDKWIGNLNSVLALSVHNQLHIAQAGKAWGFILRNGKMVTLVSPAAEKPHPLKTFGEIISGTLEPDDKVILTTPRILDYFSREKLKNILESGQSPFKIATKIVNLLNRVQAGMINMVIMELLPTQDLENQAIEPEVIYLDEKTLSRFLEQCTSLVKKLGRSCKKTAGLLKVFGHKIVAFSQKFIVPLILTGFIKLKKLAKSGYIKIKSMIDAQAVKILKKTPVENKNLEDKDGLIGKSIYNVNYYVKEKNSKNYFFLQLKRFVVLTIKKSKLSIAWLINPKHRLALYGLIIVLMLIILVANIGILRDKQKKTKESLVSEQILIDLRNKQEEARFALIYNNKEKAKAIFWEIIQETNSDSGQNNKELQEILQSSLDELDKLTTTKRLVNPKLLIQFPGAKNLFSLENYFLTVDPDNGKIFHGQKTGESSKQLSSLPQDAGGYLAGVTLDKSQLPLFYSKEHRVFILKSPVLAPDEIKSEDDVWMPTTSIASFQDNLYFLDSTAGQIYKYTAGSDGYAKKEDYIDPSNVDLKESLSLAIDGAIYVLKKDGSVAKLIKGTAQSFSLRDIPAPNSSLTDPKKIWTSAEADYLYILDSTRIVEFDKSGKFKRQFAFSLNIKDVRDFIIDLNDKKVYVLSGNDLYEMPF